MKLRKIVKPALPVILFWTKPLLSSGDGPDMILRDDQAGVGGRRGALVAGGLPALEVTLRTPAALDAIRAMAKIPGGVVGAVIKRRDSS